MIFTFYVTNIGCFGKSKGVVSVDSYEEMIIQDLYGDFDVALDISEDDKLHLTRFFQVKINDEMRGVVPGFTLERFVEVNKLDPNNIEVEYGYGGIGETEMLDGHLKLQIRPLEERHLNSPHVHVSMDKGHNYVSIRLNYIEKDVCENMDGFSKEDRTDICKLLKEYRDEFVDFYNEPLERGLIPKTVKFMFRGKEHWLGANDVLFQEPKFE